MNGYDDAFTDWRSVLGYFPTENPLQNDTAHTVQFAASRGIGALFNAVSIIHLHSNGQLTDRIHRRLGNRDMIGGDFQTQCSCACPLMI